MSWFTRAIDAAKRNDPAARSTAEIVLTYPGFHALFWHRFSHFLYQHRLFLLAKINAQFWRFLTGVEIHPGATIGTGVFIDHGMGIVIGETAEIEDDVILFHGVTLGGTGKETGKRHPTVKQGAMLSANAQILGPVTIGKKRQNRCRCRCVERCSRRRYSGRSTSKSRSNQRRKSEEIRMIKIYNTLTRKKEEFIPIQKGHVGMYVCGPTVYNYIHIGNARSTIAFDTIRRYFEYRGYKVDFVSNFTDVDDKIIRTANELGITAPEVADRFIRAFEEDTKALNVEPATLHPRVMDHMPDILAFIQVLVEKGYAYESSGDVYYRTRKFENYGKLSDQSIDELEVGASQRTGEEQQQKEDPLDFALWKQAKPGEISWDSPWGKGRPGWHIECSVMATKHLGETIDIHGGGQDLEFPHHENEIAQSEAKTGKKFANYWMHNGYVTIGEDDEKMSKSLGNFITVHEMIKNVDPQVLRFFMATTQYRRPIRYSETTMKEAATNLQRLKNTFDNLKFRQETASENLADDADKIALLENLEQRFIEEMDDDFNAANGITVVYELAKWLNTYLDQPKVSAAVLAQGEALFSQWLSIFGILFTAEELLDEEIEQLIEERNQARSNRDFVRSDEIRDLLKEKGILLEDTPQGTRWRREA